MGYLENICKNSFKMVPYTRRRHFDFWKYLEDTGDTVSNEGKILANLKEREE